MKHLLRNGLAAAALTGALCGPALAQAPLEIEDLFEIRTASGAQLSPDGRQVAFTVFDPRNVAAGEADGAGDVELYVASGPDQVRSYVIGQGRVGGVAWTPDGQALTFLARRDGDAATSLYRIALNGGEARRVFSFDTSIQSYAIGPDGDTLYFITGPAQDPAARRFAEMGFRANVYEEQQRFNRLFKASLSQPDTAPEPIEVEGHPSALVLSEDGRRLAVVVAPSTLVDD